MLFELLERQAADRPDQPAIICGDERLTWRQLREQAGRLSSGLTALGVGPDDTVAVVLPNSTLLVSALLALSRIGAQALPLHSDLTAPEILQAIEAAGSATLLAMDAAPVAGDWADRIVQVSREDFRHPSLTRLAQESPMSATGQYGSVANEKPFLQLLTSGTTGNPRRVVRSQAALCGLASAYCESVAITAADRTLCVIPLHHGHGLCAGLLAPLFSGGTLILESGFERRKTLRLLHEYQITAFSAPPHIFSILADSATSAPLPNGALRLGLTAGAPLNRDVWNKVRDRLGVPLRQLYGASETGVVTINMDANPEDAVESVGRPISGVNVAIGAGGDIAVSSPWAATWSAALEPAAALTTLADADGWIHMSDIGRFDAAGRLYLTGRKSRFINIAGRKVNPLEVEAVLATHPDVTRASVVSMRDSQGNEAAKAVVYCSVPVPYETLAAWCRERLAPYKVPRLIEVRDDADRSK